MQKSAREASKCFGQIIRHCNSRTPRLLREPVDEIIYVVGFLIDKSASRPGIKSCGTHDYGCSQ